MVSAARTTSSRWARGIKNPNEEKLSALRVVLEQSPGLSKAEMCRRIGVSKATLSYYLRVIREDVVKAGAKAKAAHDQRELSHVDLLRRLADTADQVRRDIKRVRAAGPSGAVFGGYRALVPVERLLAELLGQLQPPSQNIYLQKVDVLLNAPVDATTFSADLQGALVEARR